MQVLDKKKELIRDLKRDGLNAPTLAKKHT